jgi:hypothetical protein
MKGGQKPNLLGPVVQLVSKHNIALRLAQTGGATDSCHIQEGGYPKGFHGHPQFHQAKHWGSALKYSDCFVLHPFPSIVHKHPI